MLIIPATISNNVPGTDLSLGADTALNVITEVSCVNLVPRISHLLRGRGEVRPWERGCGYVIRTKKPNFKSAGIFGSFGRQYR